MPLQNLPVQNDMPMMHCRIILTNLKETTARNKANHLLTSRGHGIRSGRMGLCKVDTGSYACPRSQTPACNKKIGGESVIYAGTYQAMNSQYGCTL